MNFMRRGIISPEAFFLLLIQPFNEAARFDFPRDPIRDELLRIGVLRSGRGA